MQLGQKIRDLRLRRGMTVQQLAESTGLSKGFISQVENEHTRPSLATLADLATALGSSMAYFVVEEDNSPQVVRAGERRRIPVGGNTSRVESLSGSARRNLDLLLAELPPGLSAGDKLHFHHGEECLFVLEGQVRLFYGEHSLLLQNGDSCHFNGRTPHAVENAGESTARVLIALTPAAFEPLIRVRRPRTALAGVAPLPSGARG